MLLYRIALPEDTEETELYYRSDIDIRHDGETIYLNKSSVSFDTYFNSFSSGQFKRYTMLDMVSFEADALGDGSAAVYSKNSAGETHLLTELFFNSQTKIKADFPLEPDTIAYPVITANTGCEVRNMRYTVAMEPHEIRAAAVICTYRREKYVYENMKKLSEWDVPYSVFLVDNGGTIDEKKIHFGNCRLFRNKNYGGSGGFARGMIEVLHCGGFTHILLMDDDITINRTALEKTLAFLRYLRPEFGTVSVAGGMLERDRPYYQYENSARWNKGELKHLKSGLDLRNTKSLFENETEENANYGAWSGQQHLLFSQKIVKNRHLRTAAIFRENYK